jgi:hypothetical protein
MLSSSHITLTLLGRFAATLVAKIFSTVDRLSFCTKSLCVASADDF